MPGEIAYSTGDVTKALTRLALNNGDVKATAGELIDDRFQVPEDTLRFWMLEEHKQRYDRLKRDLSSSQEEQAVSQLRRTITRVGELEADLLERVGAIQDERLSPNALRALSDARAKATTELLQLTGRPVDGKTDAASAISLLGKLHREGLLRAAPGVSLEPVQVPNEAEGPDGE
jgi:hypothetical protein